MPFALTHASALFDIMMLKPSSSPWIRDAWFGWKTEWERETGKEEECSGERKRGSRAFCRLFFSSQSFLFLCRITRWILNFLFWKHIAIIMPACLKHQQDSMTNHVSYPSIFYFLTFPSIAVWSTTLRTHNNNNDYDDDDDNELWTRTNTYTHGRRGCTSLTAFSRRESKCSSGEPASCSCCNQMEYFIFVIIRFFLVVSLGFSCECFCSLPHYDDDYFCTSNSLCWRKRGEREELCVFG